MKHRKRRRPTPEVKRIRTYRERNRIVKAMGFKDYKDYLKSELWASIRSKVLAANPNCFSCGRKATQVHHGKYRKNDLEGRELRSLFAVCGGCHFKAEFRNLDKEKLNVTQATAKLKQMKRANRPKHEKIMERLFV